LFIGHRGNLKGIGVISPFVNLLDTFGLCKKSPVCTRFST
jgi:hypothetical protein